MDPKDGPDPRLGRISLLDYAQDLEQYIRELDQKPFLIGHSMGGLLAQILGARGVAKGIVLLTPASVVRKVAKKYRGISTYKEFENHAHWVIGEPGWEEIAQFVADWLNKNLD
jgi:pimeloyl-ACP methyl ester carboxylesterase